MSKGSTCLLVIDMDTTYLAPAMRQMADAGIDSDYLRQRLDATVGPNIQRLLAAARSGPARVVFTAASAYFGDYADGGRHVRGLLQSWRCQTGTTTFPAELEPRPGEPVLHKGCSSVWTGTALDYQLRSAEVSNLVIVGAMTNACVMLAATGGWDLGYTVTVVDDACVARGHRYHDMALELMRYLNIRVAATDEVAGELGQSTASVADPPDAARYLDLWKEQLPEATSA